MYILIALAAIAVFKILSSGKTPDYSSKVEADMNRIDGIINRANERTKAIKNGNY